MGFSCPVSRRYICVGIVFIRSWKQKNNRTRERLASEHLQCTTYFTDGIGQHADYFLMLSGNDALAIDLNDSVADTHTTTFSNSTAKETADLDQREGNDEDQTLPVKR